MLITISELKDIDMRKLMDIYSESNYENTDYFFPDEADKDVAWSILLDLGGEWRLDQCIKAQQDPN